MDYFFDEYPFSYNRNNYHSTPTPFQPPSRRTPSPPSWFEDNYRPTPAPSPTSHPFFQPPMSTSTPTQPLWFQDNYHSAQPPRRKTRSARKDAVSIPVKRPTTSDYALKIQKVFRGFRVRRNLQKILLLNSAVNDVANTFMDGDKVELMRCDERERLKVNEILMALLFKLDSIQGLNDSIRLCRKAVIKKAILLQEKIDSLAAEHQTLEDIGGRVDETLEDIGGKGDETLEEIGDKSGQTEGKGVQTLEEIGEIDPEREIGDKSWTMQVEDDVVEDIQELADDIDARGEEKLTDCCDNGDETAGDQLDIDGVIAGVDQMQVESTDGDADAWECVGEGDHNVEFVEKDGESSPKRELNDEWFVIEEETKESNKLLQKMAEDNKRLLQMVADLCQKNATQTTLITSLSDRVEKLEQALNDRLRRKKEKKKKTTPALKR